MLDIYTFNPTGEMAIANGMHSYMPPKKLRQFESDLAFLPSFFANTNDIIITPEIPDQEFIDLWKELGLANLQYVRNYDSLTESYNNMKPWSWNPAIHHKTKHIKDRCSEVFINSPNYSWKESSKDFFGRATTNIVQEFIHQSQRTTDRVFISKPAINISCIEDFDKFISNHDAVIVKMPWSSSGRGIHTIQPSKGFPVNYPWIKGALKQQGYITAEPLLEKIFDFSFQLDIKQDGAIEFLGFSFFINDDKGHFTGGNIHWPHQTNDISAFLSDKVLSQATDDLIKAIQSINPQEHYIGPIGVDAIVYRAHNGALKIHPCVDINWRYNMGMVNISLPKFVDDASMGVWKVSSFPKGKWIEFIDSSKNDNPLVIENGKIRSGYINMTPANEDALFGVWMEVWPR